MTRLCLLSVEEGDTLSSKKIIYAWYIAPWALGLELSRIYSRNGLGEMHIKKLIKIWIFQEFNGYNNNTFFLPDINALVKLYDSTHIQTHVYFFRIQNIWIWLEWIHLHGTLHSFKRERFWTPVCLHVRRNSFKVNLLFKWKRMI